VTTRHICSIGGGTGAQYAETGLKPASISLTSRTCGRSRNAQHGQSLVEFALIAPFFILILLSVIEAGLFLQAQSTIDNITREVARVVSVCGTTKGGFQYQKDPATGLWNLYSGCQDAAVHQEHLYYLPVTFGPTNNITLIVCSGQNILPNGHCDTTAGTTSYDQPSYVGEDVEVDLYYNYRYYIDPLMGEVAPSTILASSARVVAQQ
jgi:hypothetical protein